MKFGKYEKGVIITGIAVLIIFLILLTADGIKNIGKNNKPIALSEQEEVVPPNVPVLSAGMIPVKYNGDNLIICKNDSSWYNYEVGTPAYMMLNDGVYQSELVVDMTNKKLSSENIGQVVAKEEQGAIYMWIPRFTKNTKTKEIKYIEPEIALGGEWEISDTFIHKQVYDETKPDYSLSGIWIEKEPLANSSIVSTKVSNMTGENNSYGFIGNTVGIAEDWTIKTAIEEFSANGVGAHICARENITDLTNLNRTIIKVINEKHYEPIKARITYNETAGTIEIVVTYNKNGIQKIEDRNGNSVSYNNENGIIKATVPVKAGKNHFTIIDNKGNRKELEVTVALPIYATLYTDGTLAFTATDRVLEGKTVIASYGDISKKEYYYSYRTIPWYNQRKNITIVDIVDEICPISTAYWFFDCTNLTNILNIANMDTSNATDMKYMFDSCTGLTKLNLNNFNTSCVTDMRYMFNNCSSLVELYISNFDTSNVTNMDAMFCICSGLTKLDISNFDTGKVIKMNSMFYKCDNLIELDVSNFNTMNVTDMRFMFSHCRKLIKLDVSNFNTSNVTNMERMFQFCSSLTELDVSHFDTSNVESTRYMFSLCKGLNKLDVSSFNTSNVIVMEGMFDQCYNLTELDVSSFDTSNVTDIKYMFSYCNNLKKLDLSNFDTSNVSDMSGMFYDCNALTEINLSSFDTSNVTNMQAMYQFCSNLTELDLSSFNTAKVTNMDYMFYNCTNLKTIYVGENWKLASNRNSMFSNCGTSTTTRK